MTSAAPVTTTSGTTQGVLLMTLAMLSIPLVDGLAKHLSAAYSPLFIGWARYAVASAIVVPISAALHGRFAFPAERVPSHILRTLFLVAAMTLYFLAIARIALATAASAFFAGPIVAVMMAVVVLGERMTAGKAMALALGAAGSAVILRPGGSTDPGIVLAFASGVLFAFYLIATRHAAEASAPLPTLAFQCVVGALLLTPQAVATWRLPAAADLWLLAWVCSPRSVTCCRLPPSASVMRRRSRRWSTSS